MNSLKIKVLLVLLAITVTASAQKVFSVQYGNQADVKVFVVKYENQADLKVYKVKYENQAGENNGKWFFTEYSNQAEKKIYFVEYANQADLKSISWSMKPGRVEEQGEDPPDVLEASLSCLFLFSSLVAMEMTFEWIKLALMIW
jgi:hypothetical protein